MTETARRAPDEARALSILARAPGLKPAVMRKLIDHFGSAENALAAGRKRWTALGLSRSLIRALEKPDKSLLKGDLEWAAEPQHHLVGWGSSSYPPQLAAISAPPPILYVIGDPGHLLTAQLAIVGSRNPTPGGRELAGEFAAFAAGAGLTVTSGLALGVDAAAHAGALEGGGPTVAVMATGPDRVYPKRHHELAGRIAGQGALVTEFAPGTPPLPDHFPRRNRIISGLSQGTLVVEAAPRSGSLITAGYAADQGREVMAVPGSVRSPLSRGCHALIRDGASLIEQPSDILATLDAPLALELEPGDGRAPEQTAETDGEYDLLLDALGFNPVTVDTLAARTGLTSQAVSSMLLMLELKGTIEALAGGRYARRRNG
ncbi:MAG TPA: DNA-processing protein DprA [Gammaproteobacteria bacterium]|nr:DNA-processing protein DprA [Gammaproteobacteria bacterium]